MTILILHARTQKILSVRFDTAYQLLESGEVEGFKVGRNWRIPNGSISSYIVNQIRKRGIKNGYTG